MQVERERTYHSLEQSRPKEEKSKHLHYNLIGKEHHRFVSTCLATSILDVGWRNHQVGNLLFMTRLLMAIHHFFIRKIT